MSDHSSRPDPGLNGQWLDRLLTEKNVRKPNAKWQLSKFSLHALAVDIAVKALHHRKPPKPSDTVLAFADEYGEAAANVLRESLLRRREGALSALEQWKSLTSWDKEEQLTRWQNKIARIDAALLHLDEMMPLLRPYKLPCPKTDWHHHATSLASHFVRRLRECNSDIDVGLSNHGPVAAFVAAVIPFITGETPNLGTVAAFLKENREKVL